MSKLSERCALYTLPQEGKAQGIYPYHRCLSTMQDTEVTMEGRRVLMFGSNSYLGLTNHPKVIDAVDSKSTGGDFVGVRVSPPAPSL